VKYKFKTLPSFRKSLAKLSAAQKGSAKKAFALFRRDPFDPRLRTHKIHHLSALYKKTIYAVGIEGDLRSIFLLDGSRMSSASISARIRSIGAKVALFPTLVMLFFFALPR